jgi:hypothetical protein
MAGKNNRSGRNNRQARRGRRATGGSQTVTLSRTLLLGSLPAGNNAFEGSSILPVYPAADTIGPIAQGYSEYKFTKFVVSLVPRCSTTTLGTKWVGVSYGRPTAFSTLAQVYALGTFNVTPAYGRTGSAAVNPANSGRRFYPVIPGVPTGSELTDDNIVQAYIYLGSQGIQSGVVAADIKVSYTIQFRGPVGPGGTELSSLTSASGMRVTAEAPISAPSSHRRS